VIPFSALVLALFVGWAVYVGVAVRALREDLESKIGWLTSVSAASARRSARCANRRSETASLRRVLSLRTPG